MRPTMVCLPFGGAGEAFFRPWRAAAGSGLDLVVPPLPGRDRRIDDEPHQDVRAAVAELLPGVVDRVGDGRRTVLFGHSVGALLAYEIAARLAATPGVRLAGLVVSGSAGPGTPRRVRATGLPDEQFLNRVEALTGYRPDGMDNAELRELVLPILRADVRMHEDYRSADDPPLPVPIVALRGRDDDLVPAEQARQWAARTTGAFRLVEVPGGHMYVLAGPEPVLRVVADLLRSA